MCSNNIIIIVTLAIMAVMNIEAGVLAPAVAHVGYHHAVPYNIPPYSDRTDIFTKALSVPIAAAYAPAPVLHAAPVAAPILPHPVAYAPAPFAHAVPHAHLAPAVAQPFAAYPSVYTGGAPYGVSPYAGLPIAASPYVHAAPVASPVWRR